MLLPLYPQYSGTTTGSSAGGLAARRRGVRAGGADARDLLLSRASRGSSRASARRSARRSSLAGRRSAVRDLLSAHGLPKRIVERGDPYQWQVEATAAAMRNGAATAGRSRPSSAIRAGSGRWNGSARDRCGDPARGQRRGGLIVAPIAFVSEHSETLVELDIEYRACWPKRRACRAMRGCRRWARRRTSSPGLAALVATAARCDRDGIHPDGGTGSARQRRRAAPARLAPCGPRA